MDLVGLWHYLVKLISKKESCFFFLCNVHYNSCKFQKWSHIELHEIAHIKGDVKSWTWNKHAQLLSSCLYQTLVFFMQHNLNWFDPRCAPRRFSRRWSSRTRFSSRRAPRRWQDRQTYRQTDTARQTDGHTERQTSDEMRWDEMWDEMKSKRKWHQMKWNEMKWNEMNR